MVVRVLDYWECVECDRLLVKVKQEGKIRWNQADVALGCRLGMHHVVGHLTLLLHGTLASSVMGVDMT